MHDASVPDWLEGRAIIGADMALLELDGIELGFELGKALLELEGGIELGGAPLELGKALLELEEGIEQVEAFLELEALLALEDGIGLGKAQLEEEPIELGKAQLEEEPIGLGNAPIWLKEVDPIAQPGDATFS